MQRFLRRAGLPCLAGVLLGAAFGCGPREPENGIRNVLLIAVDTLRPDHLGTYGNAAIQTPMVDGLAANGTLFEQAVTPVPVTAPAFASLLTSTYPPTHGVRDNGLYRLSPGMLTLAEVLRRRGFQTAAFVGSAVLDSSYGLSQGFERYDDDFEGDFVPFRPELAPLAGEMRGTQRRAAVVTENALNWIKKHRQDRFFVLVHYFDPHAYYDPPPPFDSLYAANPYDGEIAYTDSQIAHLMRGIGTFEIPGRTLVVFTADHGEGLMDHGESQHGLLLYDTTLRVPLVFNCPGVCPVGLRVPGLVSLADVAPTVLALLGIRRPGSFQGTDLSPLFTGSGRGTSEVYCETFRPRLSYGWSHLQGIRTEAWKYVRAPRPELYDLRADPGETANLAGTGSGVEASLAARLQEILAAFPQEEKYRAPETARDEATRERLASLGYLAGVSVAPPEDAENLPDPKDEMEAFNRRQLAGQQTRAASFLLESGDTSAAVEAIGRALRIEPESPVRHVNAGAVLARAGRKEEAASAFRSALRLNPDYAEGYLGLAHLYEAAPDPEAALRAYRDALRVSPGLEEALLGIARVEMARGRPGEAADGLRSAAPTDPDNAAILTLEVQALQQAGRYEESLEPLGRLAELLPLDPEPPFYLAYACLKLDRLDEARRWYERVLELDPARTDAYYNLACIHARKNEGAAAVECLRKAIDRGFVDFAAMRRDPDFDGLRSLPEFQALFPVPQ
jgi:choline-sulfatase